MVDQNLDELELSIRTLNVLRSAGITTVEQLAGYSRKELRTLPNCGVRTLTEIDDVLRAYKIKLLAIPKELLEWVALHEGLINQLAMGQAVIVPLHRLVHLKIPGDIE